MCPRCNANTMREMAQVDTMCCGVCGIEFQPNAEFWRYTMLRNGMKVYVYWFSKNWVGGNGNTSRLYAQVDNYKWTSSASLPLLPYTISQEDIEKYLMLM